MNPKNIKIPGLGLEIMGGFMKNKVSGLSTFWDFHTDLEQESAIKASIDDFYPGEGWRIPDSKELNLIKHLGELGLDVIESSIDHHNYRNPIGGTGRKSPSDEFKPETLVIVRPDGEKGLRGRKQEWPNRASSVSPRLKLVRDI